MIEPFQSGSPLHGRISLWIRSPLKVSPWSREFRCHDRFSLNNCVINFEILSAWYKTLIVPLSINGSQIQYCWVCALFSSEKSTKRILPSSFFYSVTGVYGLNRRGDTLSQLCKKCVQQKKIENKRFSLLRNILIKCLLVTSYFWVITFDSHVPCFFSLFLRDFLV